MLNYAKLGINRRRLLRAGLGCAVSGAISAPWIGRAIASPVTIRYATGGGIGPNEIETVVFLPWMQENVLQEYGKSYTLDMTFTRGTPEAATLLAAGQVDMATLSFSVFANAILKDVVAGGLTIVADNYQDGRATNAANTYFVLKDSEIKSTDDLRGKAIGINAFGSAVDLALRVKLKKDGLDPRADVQIVETSFANIGPALREKRIDCGVLILPFMNAELQQGGLRALFTGGDAFGVYAALFHVARTKFLRQNGDAVRGFLKDYVHGLEWLNDPANRSKAIEITAEFTKSSAAVLESYFMTERDYYHDPAACVSATMIQTPIDAMVQEGLIDRSVEVSEHLDLSYLPGPCPE